MPTTGIFLYSHKQDYSSMAEIIALESEAFYRLLKEITEEIRRTAPQALDRWIDGEEAMRLLRITSKTTLQKFRDEGKIRFSQPEKKIILYDRDSIVAF